MTPTQQDGEHGGAAPEASRRSWGRAHMANTSTGSTGARRAAHAMPSWRLIQNPARLCAHPCRHSLDQYECGVVIWVKDMWYLVFPVATHGHVTSNINRYIVLLNNCSVFGLFPAALPPPLLAVLLQEVLLDRSQVVQRPCRVVVDAGGHRTDVNALAFVSLGPFFPGDLVPAAVQLQVLVTYEAPVADLAHEGQGLAHQTRWRQLHHLRDDGWIGRLGIPHHNCWLLCWIIREEFKCWRDRCWSLSWIVGSGFTIALHT